MNPVIKKSLFIIVCILLFSLTIFFAIIPSDSYAEELNISVETILHDIFGNKKINNAEILYGLDNESDYIYVEFSEGGYSILLKETAEILEYSVTGHPPYSNSSQKKYYAGPMNYFYKINETFFRLDTNESFNLTSEEKSIISKSVINNFRASISLNKKLDTSGIIDNKYSKSTNSMNEFSGGDIIIWGQGDEVIAPLPGSSGTTYINNAQYFLDNPRHGKNESGSCGAIAAQLLLSYHNYYSDRRILPENYLNSNWNGNTNSYTGITDYERSPNTCTDPLLMTRDTLGTNGYHESDAGTFFYTMINCIPSNAYDYQVEAGIQSYLNARNISYNTIKQTGPGNNPVSDTIVKAEINDNRPIILLMQESLGGLDHYVVAYGYMNMYSPITEQVYSGYITHFGHSDNTPYRLNVWINSNWVKSCISLTINHIHDHNTIVNNILDKKEVEVKCGICGHRSRDSLFITNNNAIVGVKCPLYGEIHIPTYINGVTITEIGNEAFANQTLFTKIVIPRPIVKIGDRAFINCTNLSEVNIYQTTYILFIPFYSCLESIGNEAFSYCTSLLSIDLPESINKLGFFAFDSSTQLTSYGGTRANVDLIVPEGTSSAYQANGWQDFNYVEIRLTTAGAIKVKSGQLRGEIHIPSFLMNRSVTEVSSEAFENQTQITSVKMDAVKNINSEAFAGCSNLERVSIVSGAETINAPDHTASYTNNYYTERCLYVRLEAGKTYTFSFNYNALTTTTPSMSDVFTSLGVGEYNFAVDLSVNTSYSNTSQGTITVVFTPTSAQLASSNKLWCRFIRTSTQATVSAQISNAQLRVGVTSISSNAFDGCAKLATDGLSYRLKANNTYAIEGMAGNANVPGEILFVPSSYNGTTVTSIDAQAFRQKNIRWAFFQSGLTAIGNRAFQFCYDLELVNLSATSVTSLEDYTFDTCKLGTFLFPTTLTTIGEGAFIRTGLIGSIPNSVTSIGNYAFSYGGRKSITLPTSLITIGSYAFYQTDLPSASNLPASVTTIGAGAFKEATLPSYFALLPNNALTTIGAEAFMECDLKRIVLSSNVTSIGNNAFTYNWTLTIYTEYSGRPAGWSTTWNNSDRPIVWGCTLSSDKSYIISFNKTATNPQNQNAEDGITNPFRKDHSFGGWYTTSDFSGTSYDDLLDVPLGMVYAEWIDMSSCVAEGTLITLADGTQVAVEDLTGNEELLVWNLFTGQYDIAPILFIDHDPYRSYEITQLYFSDGTTVKIIDEHAFWDINLNRYVFLRNDAAQYIGHWFSKQAEDLNGNMIRTNVQLVNVVVYQEQTTAWSPVTYGHLCLYVNGMLSMPGATEGLINIFEVDANTMSYDATAFLADITEYGLFTYEEFAALIPIPEEVFDAFNGQYLKVAIGKGLITLNEIALLVQRYATFFS